MKQKKYLSLIVPGLLWLPAPVHPMQTAETDPLILAVHPCLLRGKSIQRCSPLAHYLGNSIGRESLVREATR